jgi:hypothetical protein
MFPSSFQSTSEGFVVGSFGSYGLFDTVFEIQVSIQKLQIQMALKGPIFEKIYLGIFL